MLGTNVGVPAPTVSRILRRHGLPCVHELDPITGQAIRASTATTIRYEHERPGELVHMHVKNVGRTPAGGGWRVHGRAIPRNRLNGPGYDDVHSLIDDYSRAAYNEILPHEKGPTCAALPAAGDRLLRRSRHHPDQPG